MHRLAFTAACVLAAGLPAAAAVRGVANGPVTIELRAGVDATQRQVRLGDIAYLRTTDLATIQRLAALPLGEAPRAGQEAVLERDVLARWVRTRLGIAPEQIAWQGAERSVIRTPAQEITPLQIERTAQAALEQWLASRATRFAVESTGVREQLALPPGRVELKVRPLSASAQPSARMVVWVDAWVDGAFVRTVAVSFAVDAYRDAWVAAASTATGAVLARPLLEQREVKVTEQRGAVVAPKGAEPSSLQTTRVLRAGDAVTTENTRKLSAVGRGEWVTLRFASGGLQLESRAEALQEGEPGQMVKVRLAGASQPVEARVVERGRVEAMP